MNPNVLKSIPDLPTPLQLLRADDLLNKYDLSFVADVETKRFEIVNEKNEVLASISFESFEELDKQERKFVIEELCDEAIERISTH